MGEFTYNPAAPTNLDNVRLLLGDTNGDDYIFLDTEINMFLSMKGNDIYLAAAQACRTIATNSAKQAISIRLLGDVQIDRTKLPAFYMEMAKKFETNSFVDVYEAVDSFAVDVDELGRDNSEYVGDDELW